MFVACALFIKEIYPILQDRKKDIRTDDEEDVLNKMKPWIRIGVYLMVIIGSFWALWLWYMASDSVPYTHISFLGIKLSMSRWWDAILVPVIIGAIFIWNNICQEENLSRWIYLLGTLLIVGCFLWWGASLMILISIVVLILAILVIIIGGYLFASATKDM